MEFSEEYAKLRQRAEGGHGEAKYLVKIIDRGIAKLKRDGGGKKDPKTAHTSRVRSQIQRDEPVETQFGSILANDLYYCGG